MTASGEDHSLRRAARIDSRRRGKLGGTPPIAVLPGDEAEGLPIVRAVAGVSCRAGAFRKR